jgi:hypothetical protein
VGSCAGLIQASRGSQRIKGLNCYLTVNIGVINDLMPVTAVGWRWCRESRWGGGKQVANVPESVRVQRVQRDKEPVLLQLWRGGEPKRNTGYLVTEAVIDSHHIEHLSYFRDYELCGIQSESELNRQWRRNGWLGSQCKHVNVSSTGLRVT